MAVILKQIRLRAGVKPGRSRARGESPVPGSTSAALGREARDDDAGVHNALERSGDREGVRVGMLDQRTAAGVGVDAKQSRIAPVRSSPAATRHPHERHQAINRHKGPDT